MVAPAVAGATTDVSADFDGGDYVVTVEGDDGVQDLTATSTSTTISFASNNAEAMSAGGGCTGTGPVTCPIPGGDWSVVFADVQLNGGGDRFTATGVGDDAGLTVDGGHGGDDITGSDSDDYLVGGPGIDLISALGGDDIVDVRDGAFDDPSISCGDGGSDLVLVDIAEPIGPLSACEFRSPRLVGPVTIKGLPAPGHGLSMNFWVENVTTSSLVTREWFTCATADKQGCGAPTTTDIYTPKAADVGRYLFGVVSVGLAEFGYLGRMDSVESAPTLIFAEGEPYPDNDFFLGTFKSSSSLLTIKVPGPGTLTLSPPKVAKKKKTQKTNRKPKLLVAKTSKAVTAAGTVQLRVKLTPEGKRQLRKKGTLKLKLRVSFKPTGGITASKTASVTFRAKRKK